MLPWIVQFCVGLLFANAGEWFMHRYLLHHYGRHAGSLWAHHLHEHHHAVRQPDMLDSGYLKCPRTWNTQAKEILTLCAILLMHAPFFWWANGFAWAVYLSVFAYYFIHRQAHVNPNWAKTYLPWHYDHHLLNSNANWCITYPLFDYLMKTRHKKAS